MITVKVSDQPYLHIPRSLSKKLSLADGDQVEMVHQGELIILHRCKKPGHPRSLQALAGLVKTSRPRASIDVAIYMNKKGYEYLHGLEDFGSLTRCLPPCIGMPVSS